MSFNSTFARRVSLLVAALCTTGSLVTATTVNATRGGDIYQVEFTQPAEDRVTITRNIGWTCEDTRCVAPEGSYADRHVCIWIAREMGTLTSFSSRDRVFTQDELAACNARA